MCALALASFLRCSRQTSEHIVRVEPFPLYSDWAPHTTHTLHLGGEQGLTSHGLPVTVPAASIMVSSCLGLAPGYCFYSDRARLLWGGGGVRQDEIPVLCKVPENLQNWYGAETRCGGKILPLPPAPRGVLLAPHGAGHAEGGTLRAARLHGHTITGPPAMPSPVTAPHYRPNR